MARGTIRIHTEEEGTVARKDADGQTRGGTAQDAREAASRDTDIEGDEGSTRIRTRRVRSTRILRVDRGLSKVARDVQKVLYRNESPHVKDNGKIWDLYTLATIVIAHLPEIARPRERYFVGDRKRINILIGELSTAKTTAAEALQMSHAVHPVPSNSRTAAFALQQYGRVNNDLDAALGALRMHRAMHPPKR